MCLRCRSHFTIHNTEEIKTYLREDDYDGIEAKRIVKLWFERGYMNNLIYLEWKSEQRDSL